jgi:predicted ATPase
MPIRQLIVRGLNGRSDFNLNFNHDINIVTGKNGSGKTTVLKLAWYMISGNLEWIPTEINIATAEAVTDGGTITVHGPPSTGKPDKWTFKVETSDKTYTESATAPHYSASNILRLNKVAATATGSSIFLPTFRRMEGGFSMGTRGSEDDEFIDPRYRGESNSIDIGLAKLSRLLTVGQHRFIASISTNDIVGMLTKKYANISDLINEGHRSLSDEIIGYIKSYQIDSGDAGNESAKLSQASDMLKRIQTLVADHSNTQELLLKPFSALSDLISKIFQHKGIKLTSRLTLGSAGEAIESASLSAGEKQMLSFLTYNAFEQGSTIFIDEPEISLHVDWQRILFPTLFSQGTSNQFVVATHSPFIYSKYPDKEVMLDPDRGYSHQV